MRKKMGVTTNAAGSVWVPGQPLYFRPTADPTGTVDDALDDLLYTWQSSDLTVGMFRGGNATAVGVGRMAWSTDTSLGRAFLVTDQNFPILHATAVAWQSSWSLTLITSDADWKEYRLGDREVSTPASAQTHFFAGGSSYELGAIADDDLRLMIGEAGGSFPTEAIIKNKVAWQASGGVTGLETAWTAAHPGNWTGADYFRLMLVQTP